MKRIILADDGKTDYRIIISVDASPSERHAAEELGHFLKIISGAKFEIATDEAKMEDKEILLGLNRHLDKLGIDIDFKALGDEGFVIKTYESYLVIAGGRLRGTMYGVYTFLEKYLGCRWFTSKVSRIPRLSRIELGPIDDLEIPAFEYRDVYYTDAFDGDWAARNKVNGAFARLDEKRGGKITYYPFVHSFDMLIPRELYQEHPEYFPMIEGKRVSGYVQRCLSNPDVVKMAIKRVKQWIKEHPEAKIISVSQNDTGKWCQCPQCKALDEAEGSPSASIIKFVNRIAEEIEKEHPDKFIDTLAYTYSRKPPKTLKPRRNVIVRLCTIECCFSHPLESCSSEENRRFREDIEEWSRIAPKLYVWDYVTNFAHYLLPFPNLYVLKPNLQFFAKHGVKGVYEEGNYSPGGGGEFAELRAYVLAKLLWNPNQDVDKLIDEFLEGYYGRAAPLIREYIDMLHEKVEKENIHIHIFNPPTAKYLTEELVLKADELFRKAEELAENEEVRLRVKIAHLPIQYVMIERGFVEGEELKRLVKEFFETIEKVGITHISEVKTVDRYREELEERLAKRS